MRRHGAVILAVDDGRSYGSLIHCSMTSRKRSASITTAGCTSTEMNRAITVARALRGAESLRATVLAVEQEFAAALLQAAPNRRESLRNLLHYLAFRRQDLRLLRQGLNQLGLSSLHRVEAHVLASLNAVLEALVTLGGHAGADVLRGAPALEPETGLALLAEHAAATLGPLPSERGTRLMATVPPEAADNPALVTGLLADGMNIARLDASHGDARAWTRIVRNLHRAEKELGCSCRVAFDLAGPALRIGPIAPGPAVARWRPARGACGEVIASAIVRLVRPVAQGVGVADGIPVDAGLVARTRPGDRIRLTDARGRKRSLAVVERTDDFCICTADATAYVTRGTKLVVMRGGHVVVRSEVGTLPPLPGVIELRSGDGLDLVLGEEPGRGAAIDGNGAMTAPARVGCALPEVFRAIRIGERVLLDDGAIQGVVAAITEGRFRIEVRQCAGGSVKLRGGTGIRFPDSDLQLPALMPKDRADLAFAARHGDIVTLPFVERVEVVEEVIAELGRIGARNLGVAIRIESGRAFHQLPRLLASALRHANVAIVLAPASLGVDVGFERLPEMQEEILRLCRAAHVPVIWATPAHGSLATGGAPSRAEVTDAAVGIRADCILSRDGRYAREAIRFQGGVIARIQAHRQEDLASLRKLGVSDVAPMTIQRAGGARVAH